MKKILTKIKNWLFRPISPKTKSKGIVILLGSLAFYSIFISFFAHWLCALIPLAMLGLVLYLAKIPVKQENKPEIQDFKRKGVNYGKKR